jgi:peptide-methionine (R)-S-oxide reductase
MCTFNNIQSTVEHFALDPRYHCTKYISAMKKMIFFMTGLAIVFSACAQTQPTDSTQTNKTNTTMSNTINKTDEDWKKELTPEEYRVLRQHGTERAFTGEFYDNHDEGTYTCAGCGTPLFLSDTKFNSGTGWPSYYAPMNDSCVAETKDTSLGMVRAEVHCAKCGGHLGHVFDDGPKPTGLRYCINSVSLDFKKK